MRRASSMEESKKCPNCDYEGLMDCWSAMNISGMISKCPNCKFTFGNKLK